MSDTRSTTSPAPKTDGRTWKFAVVKRMFGMNGKKFDFPTAATFAVVEDACAYAERFAREQSAAGVTHADFVVRARKGGEWVKVYRADDYRQEVRS
jgi:hypothetical protein